MDFFLCDTQSITHYLQHFVTLLFWVFENTLWRGSSGGSCQLLLHYLVSSSTSVPHPALPVGPHFVFFRSLICSSFRFKAAFTFSWCACADVNFPLRLCAFSIHSAATIFRLASAWHPPLLVLTTEKAVWKHHLSALRWYSLVPSMTLSANWLVDLHFPLH